MPYIHTPLGRPCHEIDARIEKFASTQDRKIFRGCPAHEIPTLGQIHNTLRRRYNRATFPASGERFGVDGRRTWRALGAKAFEDDFSPVSEVPCKVRRRKEAVTEEHIWGQNDTTGNRRRS